MIEFIYESPIFEAQSSKGVGNAGSKHQKRPKSAYREANTNVDMNEKAFSKNLFSPLRHSKCLWRSWLRRPDDWASTVFVAAKP